MQQTKYVPAPTGVDTIKSDFESYFPYYEPQYYVSLICFDENILHMILYSNEMNILEPKPNRCQHIFTSNDFH